MRTQLVYIAFSIIRALHFIPLLRAGRWLSANTHGNFLRVSRAAMKCYKKQIFACPSVNTVEYSRWNVHSLCCKKNYRNREKKHLRSEQTASLFDNYCRYLSGICFSTCNSHNPSLRSYAMVKITMSLFAFRYDSINILSTLFVPKNECIVTPDTFMQPDFTQNVKRSETIDSRGEVISKMTRSCRRMKDRYFSNILDPHLVRFSAAPILCNPFFLHAHRSHFAFPSCCPMLLQLSSRLLFSPSLALTVGEFFSVHLLRQSHSSDCLGKYTDGLKDIPLLPFSFYFSLFITFLYS